MTIITENGTVAVNYDNVACITIDDNYNLVAYLTSKGEMSVLIARGASEKRAQEIFNHIVNAVSIGADVLSLHDICMEI